MRQVLRYHPYSYRAEQAYCDWIVRYVKFHGSWKHPRDMGLGLWDVVDGKRSFSYLKPFRCVSVSLNLLPLKRAFPWWARVNMVEKTLFKASILLYYLVNNINSRKNVGNPGPQDKPLKDL